MAMLLLNPDLIRWVVLHCTASSYGDVDTIDAWHRENGWAGIGYHWLITNCYPTYDSWVDQQPDTAMDGVVHQGRPEKFQGAHVKGENWQTLGVAMVGGEKDGFTSRQLESAARLCTQLIERYPSIEGVKGHYEFNTRKTCPDLDMDYFRRYILTTVE